MDAKALRAANISVYMGEKVVVVLESGGGDRKGAVFILFFFLLLAKKKNWFDVRPWLFILSTPTGGFDDVVVVINYIFLGVKCYWRQ